MENDIIDFKHGSSESPLSLSSTAITHLTETSKWGKFLAIVGFCSTGLLVIVGIFMGSIFASLSQQNPFGGYIGLIYAALGLVYFFPSLYLFRYSTKLKRSLASKDNEELTAAFENEKSMFKFMGIFTIVILGLYVLIIVGSVLAALFA